MTTQSNKCPFCGTSLSVTARYCDSCGTPLKQADRPAPTRRRERPRTDRVSVWLFLAVVLAVFGTGTLGGYVYRGEFWPAVPVARPTGGSDLHPESPTPLIPPGQKQDDPALSRYMRSMVTINVRGQHGNKTGSGFLIDGMGHIITSAHVIEGYRGCVGVIDDNGMTHLAAVVDWDRNIDVAMLHAPTLSKWPDVLTLRSTPVQIGDQVWVLNSPKGTPNASLLGAQVEQVGLAKRIDERFYGNLVEFRGATVLHGSSGSPLLHRESGQAVGVVTAATDANLAFAVPFDPALLALITKWSAEPATLACNATASDKSVHLVLATITPLSGTHGIWGNDLASGVELALRDMEADLRKVGYEVSIARYDDMGQPQTARDLAQVVLYDREVIGVVGSFTSPVSAALADALKGSGLVMVAPTAGAEELTAEGWPHFHRLVPSNARLEAAAASYAQRRLRARSVLMVLDGSASADSRARSFETSAQIIALPVTGRIKLTSPFDGEELKKKVLEAGADLVYYAGSGQTGLQVAQTLRQGGINLPLIGGADLYNPAFQNLMGPHWKGIYFTHFTDGFDERFERHFATILGRPTRGYGAYGYDSARVILEALVRYGEQNPAKVPARQELAALVRATRDYPGWSGAISFDRATGENLAARVYLFEWVNGTHELRESLP